jgi:hypothetical protein
LFSKEILQEPYLTFDSPRHFFILLIHLLRRIDLIEKQFEQIIYISQQEAPTQMTICYETKKKSLDKIEEQISIGLGLVLNAIEKQITYMLTNLQDKNDFIGSEANMSLSSSRACRQVIDYLQPILQIFSQGMVSINVLLYTYWSSIRIHCIPYLLGYWTDILLITYLFICISYHLDGRKSGSFFNCFVYCF